MNAYTLALILATACGADQRPPETSGPASRLTEAEGPARPAECVALDACTAAIERALCEPDQPCQWSANLDFRGDEAAVCTEMGTMLTSLLTGLAARKPDFVRPTECAGIVPE